MQLYMREVMDQLNVTYSRQGGCTPKLWYNKRRMQAVILQSSY